MKRLHLIALAPLALAACKGSGDTITNNSTASAVSAVPDSVVVNGVTYVREGSGGIATPAAAPTVAAPVVAAPIVTPTISSAPVDPANLPPTQPSPGDGHGG